MITVPSRVATVAKICVSTVLSFSRSVLAFVAAFIHSRALRGRQNNTGKIRRGDILLFCVLRNEAQRLTFFLNYYRNLGVNHFIFVDNGSTDNFQALVEGEPDVSVFSTESSFKNAKFGMHWLNSLLRIYGSGHWCVTCDADEIFDFPGARTGGLRGLVDTLHADGQPSLYAVMIDMYGVGRLSEAVCSPGTDPLEVTPFFDKSGYVYHKNWKLNTVFVRGGVRQRTAFPNSVSHAPPLNKIPLIRWRWYYSYYASTHIALPVSLNGAHAYCFTGALLHFKFLSTFPARIEEERERKQHAHNSREYEAYAAYLDGGRVYSEEVSVKYAGCEQLVDLGLVKQEAKV